MKFTLRRSGLKMVTLTTKHHIGSRGFAEVLCRFADEWQPDVWNDDTDTDEPDLGKDMTKTQVDNVIRQALWSWGSDAYQSEGGFNDDGNLTEGQALMLVEWAVRQIRRLFPDLDDAELAEYLKDHQSAVADRQARGEKYRAGLGIAES